MSNARPVKQVETTVNRVDPDGDQDATQAPELDKVENGQDGYTYYLVRRESVDKYIRPRRIGADVIGFRQQPAWEVVSEDDAERVGRGRADQGSSLDSAVGRGQMILLRMKTEDYENSIGWLRRTITEARTKALYSPETKSFGTTSVSTINRLGHVDRGAAAGALPSFQGR